MAPARRLAGIRTVLVEQVPGMTVPNDSCGGLEDPAIGNEVKFWAMVRFFMRHGSPSYINER